MMPPNIASPDFRAFQDRVTDAIAAALKSAGVSHLVTLSSIGADKPEKTGPVWDCITLSSSLTPSTA
jgi:hypothetical protein